MKNFVYFCLISFCLASFSSYSQASKPISPKITEIIKDSLFAPHDNFEYAIKRLYIDIKGSEHNLDFKAFRYAYIGYQNMKLKNKLNEKRLLSIIDFTKDSDKKRFYTIDLEAKKILYYTYVAHGKKTGMSSSTYFSNEDFFQKNGRYGRSLGCPVLPTDIYKQVIETIKEGTMVFAYYTNKRYLASSKYLKVSDLTKNNTF